MLEIGTLIGPYRVVREAIEDVNYRRRWWLKCTCCGAMLKRSRVGRAGNCYICEASEPSA